MGNEQTGIAKAIEAAGSQEKLAEALGCTQQNVSIWKGQGWAPIERAREIEMLYGIPRMELASPKIINMVDTGSGL